MRGLLGRRRASPSTSSRLPDVARRLLPLVELGRRPLAGPGAQGLLKELARLAALAAREPLRLDAGLALGVDRDLDGLHSAPPSWMVSLIEPSGRACSTILWPRLRASILAFSAAYRCRRRSSCRGSPHKPPKLSYATWPVLVHVSRPRG